MVGCCYRRPEIQQATTRKGVAASTNQVCQEQNPGRLLVSELGIPVLHGERALAEKRRDQSLTLYKADCWLHAGISLCMQITKAALNHVCREALHAASCMTPQLEMIMLHCATRSQAVVHQEG